MPSTNIFDDIDSRHRIEWIDSFIDNEVIDLNLNTVTDAKTIDTLIGWKGTRWKPAWKNGGGWVAFGEDVLGTDTAYSGLQFKPDTPREIDGKTIKYESPRKGHDEAPSPLFIFVPDRLWQEIADHYGCEIADSDRQKGFWAWKKLNPQVPLVITEGAKKAASSFSALVPAISIPGVSNGQWKGKLNPAILEFMTIGQTLLIAFDSDLQVKRQVRNECDRLCRLVAQAGAVPMIVSWEFTETSKGLDDLIVKTSRSDFRDLCQNAITFEVWRKQEIEIDQSDIDDIPVTEHFNQIGQKTLYGDKPWVCIFDVLHYWTGTHYEASNDATEKRRISEFCNQYKIYDHRTGSRCFKYANDTAVNGVLKWVKMSYGIDPTKVNPTGLNLANGILSIHWQGKQPSWKIRKHDPSVVYTYCSKVAYNPKADPGPCDRLLIALDDSQRDVFLKTIAACLDLGNVRKVMPDRLRGLLLQGDGSNGKDTLREAISEIFSRGITGCSLRDFQQYDEGKKFPLAKLEYSRINWASENHSRLSLDSLQSLKNVLTGDPVDIERKNQDDYSIKPACIVLLNCNEAPSIVGAQKAIESRYAIVKFAKTFTSDPQSPDELPADPRFKNDPEFLQNHVCPSLLNRLLDALSRLMTEGIDYKPLAKAIQDAKESSCHLIRWASEIGLETGKGKIKIGDLYESLKSWYVEQGVLDIELTTSGKEKFDWLDEGNRFDPWVKAPRLMRQSLTKIFPKASFSERTEHGFFVLGIQSQNFAISPNFGVFASSKEEDIYTVKILPNESNNESNKNSSYSMNQIEHEVKSSHEANKNQSEPIKPSHIKENEVKQQTEPNLHLVNNYSATITKFDQVAIFDLKNFTATFDKVKNLPDTGYEVKEIKGTKVTIYHRNRKLMFEVPISWLMKIPTSHGVQYAKA